MMHDKNVCLIHNVIDDLLDLGTSLEAGAVKAQLFRKAHEKRQTAEIHRAGDQRV